MKVDNLDKIPLVLLEIDCRWSQERAQKAFEALPTGLQQRAKRYIIEAPRRTLIASHTILHRALRALGEQPERIVIAENGRPYVEGSEFEFNLSHSQDSAIVALSRGETVKNALGVDIESVNRRVDHSALAQRFFTETEQRYIAEDPIRFFFVWTRKEALLKSNGTGLRVSLDSFDVLESNVPAAITGADTVLGSRLRNARTQVSWALPKSRTDHPVVFLNAERDHWESELVATLKGKN